MPLTIINGAATIPIGNMPAARVTDQETSCILPGCVPGGPGMITHGSATAVEA